VFGTRLSYSQEKLSVSRAFRTNATSQAEKHMCVEKDIEIVPMQKLVTVLPEDTFGISKVLPD
jgi:hypothetical protein